VAADYSGNVYVTEEQNNRVQKFDPSGNFLLAWGSPGSGNGQFNTPLGVAVDYPGNVYVADAFNHRVQKFDGYGNFILAWGSEGSGNAQFEFPFAVAVDSSFNVYVTDAGNVRVDKFALQLVSLPVHIRPGPILPSISRNDNRQIQQ